MPSYDERRGQVDRRGRAPASRSWSTCWSPPSASCRGRRTPTSTGADTFAGPSFHSATWDHDVDLRGQAGRRDRHRRQRHPVRAGDPARGRAPDGLPADAAVPHPADGPGVLEAPPQGLREGAGDAARRARHLVRRHRGAERRLGLLQDAGGGRSRRRRKRHMRKQAEEKPGLFEKVWPTYQIGCKRILFSSDYVPALAAAERRPGHRRHRGDHAHRGPAPSTAPSIPPT